jgi:hypothetical protein
VKAWDVQSRTGMILQLLHDDRWRPLAFIVIGLTLALMTGCQNNPGGGGGY